MLKININWQKLRKDQHKITDLFFIYRLSLFILILMLGCSESWANSSLEMRPLSGTVLPKSILRGQTATAYYAIFNNTITTIKGIYIKYLPPNVTQVVNDSVYGRDTCGKYFDLNPKMFCILQLNITGEVDVYDVDPTHHLMACYGETDCVGIEDKNNELNVTIGKANMLAHSVIVSETNTGAISYSSTDGGVSWTSHAIQGLKGIIRGATCSGNNGQYCTAVGDYYDNGYETTFLSYTSTDGGVNWSSHPIEKHGGASGLFSVSCNGAYGQYCVAVGGFSSVRSNKSVPCTGPCPIAYTSLDGGMSWTSHVLERKGKYSSLRAISCSGNNGQYCTAIGDYYGGYANKHNITMFVAYTSSDNGNTWVSHAMGGDFYKTLFTGITCKRDRGQYCIAVGYSDIYNGKHQAISYISSDGGENWTGYIPKLERGSKFNAITCNDKVALHCIAVGYSAVGSIFLSVDGGINWTVRSSNSKDILSAITCSGNLGQYCTAIGYSLYFGHLKPVVYKSTDGGETWVKRNSHGFVNFGAGWEEIRAKWKDIRSVGINVVSGGIQNEG